MRTLEKSKAVTRKHTCALIIIHTFFKKRYSFNLNSAARAKGAHISLNVELGGLVGAFIEHEDVQTYR